MTLNRKDLEEDFRDRDRQAGEKMLGRLEGNGSICEQFNSYQYNQLPLEMLKAWWWKWNLLDSSGPMGLTEPSLQNHNLISARKERTTARKREVVNLRNVNGLQRP